MIYFVDEDSTQLTPYIVELELRGYQVVPIDNADDAYKVLSGASDIQLVILDIMLAAGPSGTSRFSRERTHDFILTGLALLEDLNNTNAAHFPRRVVVFSMANQDWVVNDIRKAAEQYQIAYLQKRDYPSPFGFGEKIAEILKGLGS